MYSFWCNKRRKIKTYTPELDELDDEDVPSLLLEELVPSLLELLEELLLESIELDELLDVPSELLLELLVPTELLELLEELSTELLELLTVSHGTS